ncbi:MAG TPA: hypothetical protein VJ810_08375 [Blastocatellia bacterium]|nr:hypothetical protein [Blastocatellia bacterium]
MALETDSMLILIPQEDAPTDKLRSFIEDVLYQAGVWESPRMSDGISSWRLVESDPSRVRLCGRIYEISQEVYPFWLDLARDKERHEQVNWTLYFDFAFAPLNPRRSAMVTEVIDVPEQAEWRVALMGAAVIQAETLVAESVFEVSVDRGEDAW